jgi:hypothetical protein
MSDPSAYPEPQPQQRKPRPPWVVLAAVIAAVLLIAAGTFYAYTRLSGPTLAGAEKQCNDGPPGTTLADGGKTLIIDGRSESQQLNGQGTGVDSKTEACILKNLGVTAAVLNHMDNTRALDGRQTDSWDGFTASWTYHPDDGLDITIQKK